MACSIKPVTSEDYITRRWFLKMSHTCLHALEKRVNIVVSTDDTAASKLPDGSIWYEVKQSNQTTE